MKYEKVVDMDLNNGDGIGVTLWVTGCPHHCYGCHNKRLWDENRGKEDYIEALNKNLEGQEKQIKALEENNKMLQEQLKVRDSKVL